ncbi:MAG: PorP/SprF family type IX secretion system membrane protein [Prolixibacteraceae bacterium]|nr:PorP/SprF family type IX secretion system membrane protein [Prolixibacteraceae bacterium]
MKKILIIILVIAPLFTLGQFNPQLSQLIKTLEFINPGYNASKDLASATLLYRNQWTGFEGAPQTMAANINVPVNKWHMGFGANTLVESRGLITHSNIDLTACVDVKVTNTSYMAFGLSGGAELRRIDMGRAVYMGEQDYSAAEYNGENVHAGIGLNYFSPKLHLGASMHYSQLDGNRYAQNEFYSFYVNGSYLIPVHDNWVLKPAVLFKTWGGYSDLDAGLFVLFKDIVWGGISYRLGDALVFFADFKITDMFRLGYSYDLGLRSVSDFNYGSHEIRIEFTMPRPQKKFERMAMN